MAQKLSQRLAEIVEALPLKPDIRILEIGCGTGAVAREIAQRIGDGYILGIDRSSKAIGQALKSSEAEILKGNLSFRRIEIENFELEQGEGQFDIAFAVRVGALDGRHPEIERGAIAKIAKVLKPEGKLFIDGGNPLKEILLKRHMKHISSASDVLLLKAGEGRSYNCGTMTAVFKADENETNEMYSVSEWWLEPNSDGPGVHQHQNNDEIFYVLEGTVSLLADDKWIEADKGSFIRIPSKTDHDFANRTDKRAGLLNFFIPGGFERNMPAILKWFEENPSSKKIICNGKL